MDDLEDHFGRLAAITPNLALILCGVAPRSRVNSRAATSPRLRPKIAGETRETQSIVTVESQLGVS
jgi:hypothetical protein